ncbi:MAG: HAMP domain-containing sensor histidine kinase [Clostridiales bacterium]|nr:HAMP domain-containing sensor histidine kinase [Clostridiales bacterium]
MLKRYFQPYTFRGKLMIALYISAAFAAIISLMLAYVISHVNVQNELQLQQNALAVYLLEIDKRTDLTLPTMLGMMDDVEDTHVELVAPDAPDLPDDLFTVLSERSIYSVLDDMSKSPITYVQLNEGLVRITSLYERSLFMVAFFRIISASLTFLAVFVLMTTFASFRLSKPVQALTRAHEQVQEGDFSVRLPDNQPGEMGELMRSFNDMTEALGSTAYLQKDFISSISHEFKTPIASIRGFAKLLQMPGLTEEQKAEYIQIIAQESDRLSRLSETLLRLSALEQQTALASIATFSLDEQLRQVILRLEPTWSAKDIDWQLDLQEVSITSDQELLNQVWVNIIQNAIKFSPEGTDIEVRVFREENAIVEIQDHGCGMTEEAQKRIFDKFYQADKSRKQEGVGLGLSLVKRIVDMLGGTVSVTSAVGEGSTFRVELPVSPPRHIHAGQAAQANDMEVQHG